MIRLVGMTAALLALAAVPLHAADSLPGPYDLQVNEQLERLENALPAIRASAAESLGWLRAYRAEQALLERLDDAVAEVRRETVMAISWCGGRKSIGPLLRAR